MSRYQLAQLNIGVIRRPIDSPIMAAFVAKIDRINALAEQSPVQSLNHSVYKTARVQMLKRRKEWFERRQGSHMALWRTVRGHIPTVQEAMARLEYRRAHGPSERAFSFHHAFPAPDAAPAPAPAPTPPLPGDACPAR